jgi:hypothetical protein
MAEIISTVNEDNEGKCVIVLNAEELDALTDILTDWMNDTHRVAHINGHSGAMNYVNHNRYVLNDVFLGVCGWVPVDEPPVIPRSTS